MLKCVSNVVDFKTPALRKETVSLDLPMDLNRMVNILPQLAVATDLAGHILAMRGTRTDADVLLGLRQVFEAFGNLSQQ